MRAQDIRRHATPARTGAISVAVLLWLLLPSVYTFFLIVFIIWLAFRLDSRSIGAVAIFFLVCIPVLRIFGQQAYAQQFAVYVFLLLCLMVTLQIAELLRPHQASASDSKHLRFQGIVRMHLVRRYRGQGIALHYKI